MYLSVNNIKKSFKASKFFNTENSILNPSLKNRLENNSYHNVGNTIFGYSRSNICTKNINTFYISHKKHKKDQNWFLSISSQKNKNFLHDNIMKKKINSIKYRNLQRLIPNTSFGDLNRRKIYVNNMLKTCFSITKLNPPNMNKTKSFASVKNKLKKEYLLDVFKKGSNFISYNTNTYKNFYKNEKYFINTNCIDNLISDNMAEIDKSTQKNITIKQNSQYNDRDGLKFDENIFRNCKYFTKNKSNFGNIKKNGKKYENKLVEVDI